MTTKWHQSRYSLTAALAGAAVLSTSLMAGSAAVAQDKTPPDKRQQDKNNMRNLGTGLGGVALFELLRGKGTNALILGAGAAYAGKKYNDAKEAQKKEEEQRQERNRRDNNRYGSRTGRSTYVAEPIDVYVNEDRVNFTNQKPEMTAGNVYVPMRGVLEKMGADVRWDPTERAVVAMHGDKTVKLPLNGMAVVNGEEKSLATPAYVENGHTMVPLRFLAETFGAQVAWDAQGRDVKIHTPNSSE